VSRGWLYSSVIVGLLLGILFAAHPFWDLAVAARFFDPDAAKFPLSITYE
jgi:hypothetical protein